MTIWIKSCHFDAALMTLWCCFVPDCGSYYYLVFLVSSAHQYSFTLLLLWVQKMHSYQYQRPPCKLLSWCGLVSHIKLNSFMSFRASSPLLFRQFAKIFPGISLTPNVHLYKVFLLFYMIFLELPQLIRLNKLRGFPTSMWKPLDFCKLQVND